MLTRDLQNMPADIAAALDQSEMRPQYDARPAYQRNDYLAWIGRAKQPATRDRRIAQMLDELRTGGVYMGMIHRPSARR
ncbi:MAG: YdeI/OmpD-associated family protein [Actinobacteria bacterium]|nr:YdeI/OmpD-associated family protein [Actinomycetota bacterium]